MMTLLTDHLITLRVPEPYDIDMFLKWENDTSLWDTGSTSAPFSRQVISDYITNYNPDIYTARQLRLMITLTETGESVGAVDLYDFDPVNNRAGIGFVIDVGHRGQGYAEHAVNLVARYAMERLRINQLYALAGVDNAASIATLERCGFTRSGPLSQWIATGRSGYTDAIIFQLLANPGHA